MLKSKTSLLLVLPVLLVIGLAFSVTGVDKPFDIRHEVQLSPSSDQPAPDPNFDLKDELATNSNATTIPLDQPPTQAEIEDPSAEEIQRQEDELNNLPPGASLSEYGPEKEPLTSHPPYGTGRVGGEDIATATAITSLPFNDSDDLCAFLDDYEEACPYSSTSPDAVYSFTPAADMTIDITLCNGSDYDTKLFVYENAETPGSPFACNDDACPGYVSELLGLNLTGGNTYYIVIDGYGGDCGTYVIDVTEYQEPDPFDCPAGSITENEPCGDDTNGGCNMTPPTFEAINDGDIVCGTVWADADTRDTDWYEFTLTSTQMVTWKGSAEFDFVIGFVDTADCALASALDPYATGIAGDIVEVSTLAGPGTYYLFVSHQEFTGSPCGTNNGYWAEVTTSVVTGACCDPAAGTCTPDVEEADCLAMYGGTGIWHANTSCDPNPCVSNPGDNCDDPLTFTIPADLPYDDVSQYTCDRGNDYLAADMCYGYGYGADEDVVYEFTVTEETDVIMTIDPKGTTWTYCEIRTECVPPNGDCVFYFRSTGGEPYGSGLVTLAAGTYYMIIDSWVYNAPYCIPDFDLHIEEFAGSNPGDACDNPISLKIPGDMVNDSVVVYDSTCGHMNYYDGTCLGSYDGGEDLIFELDIETAMTLDIVLDPMGTTYSGMALHSECPLPSGTSDCMYKVTGSSSDPKGFYNVTLDPGLYYVMIDNWPSPACIPELTFYITVSGGGPENDDWDKCFEMGEDSVDFNTSAASFDGPGGCQTAPNVWFCYTASCDGEAIASLCGSGYDTKMAVYDGVGDPSALTVIECNDDFCSLQSEVSWTAVAGNSYLIEVGGYGSNTGAGHIITTCEPDTCTPPPNDNCADVTPVDITVPGSQTFTGDNTCSHPDCPLLDDDGHAWEAFTIDAKADVEINYCGTTPAFELVYIVIADACPCDAGSGEMIWADPTDWDICGDGNITMYFAGLDAGTYYIPVLSDHPSFPTEYYEGPYTINVIANEWVPAYCDASGGCDEYISNVTVGEISNSSACDGYADYTAMQAFMAPGASYDISIENGNGYGYDICAVWIDWNGDYDFNDAGEEITLTVNTGYGPYEGTITVPTEASVGVTRMRVRVQYGGTPAPCGATSYGEVEDYGIVVGGEPSTLIVDPPLMDFGTVDPDASGDATLTLTADGEIDISFNIEVVHHSKVGYGGGVDLGAPEAKASPVQHQSFIPAQGDKGTWFEGFEAGVPPAGWEVADSNVAGSTWTTGSYAPYEGSYYATVHYDDTYSSDQFEWLISEAFDLDGNYAVSFYWNMSYYWGVDPYDNYDFEVYLINGPDTVKLWDEHAVGTFTNWEWYNTTIPLTDYMGASGVKVAFVYSGNDGAQLSLDAVEIVAAPMNWLSVSPESGVVPGNGSTPVTVSINMIGMDYGLHEGDLVINHTGVKSTMTVPVAVTVGETGTNITMVDPEAISVAMAYALDTLGNPFDMTADFYLGGEFAGGGYVVEDINASSLTVNGLVPTSTEILENVEGFSGHVMKMTVDMSDFITGYEPLFVHDMQSFDIEGYFGTEETNTFVQDGQVMMLGHLAGDANFDGSINLLDITKTINYLYNNGDQPQPIIETGDSNGDGTINLLDITRTIRYLYGGGPAPTHP